MPSRRIVLTGLALVFLGSAVPVHSTVLPANGSARVQLDPRLAVFCLALGGSPNQCLDYLRPEGR